MNSVEEMIGRKVRDQRKLVGFSQAQLAERVGVSNETICRMETGKCVPSLHTIERVARVLRVDLRELFRAPRSPTQEDAAIDRLIWLMRRRSVAEIELVIDIATRVFEHARAQHPIETKRAKHGA